ncbi:MAG: cytochrome c oxidase assembly protein subunit 15 [Myxococcota bacterium]|jgi:cytochrome c oxidase assembly protein subunit 15
MDAYQRHRRAIGYWLLVLCAMTFAMVVLGGLTRLTESGLSMTDWSATGSLPPLSEAAWLAEFARYQAFPEYQEVNHGMALADFKAIFWFEYSHRMLGRTIGTAFLLPFLFFLARRAIPRALAPKLLVLFVLGGMQGLIGWWMVRSGLIDRPDVSHYRLTTHLGSAFVLYAALLWVALSQLRDVGSRTPVDPRLARILAVVCGMVFVTVLSGGLVAGLNAGFAFNTFPLMGGQVVPPGYLMLEPWWSNLTENPASVQFHHRVLALTTFAAVVAAWVFARGRALAADSRRAMNALLAVALTQVVLGITTLLTVVWLPVASLHQTGALVLLSVAVWACHTLWRPVRGIGAGAGTSGAASVTISATPSP